MERETAVPVLIERAGGILRDRTGALIAEADDIDRRLGEIERDRVKVKDAWPAKFDRRLFDLRARLTAAQVGLEILSDRLGLD